MVRVVAIETPADADQSQLADDVALTQSRSQIQTMNSTLCLAAALIYLLVVVEGVAAQGHAPLMPRPPPEFPLK